MRLGISVYEFFVKTASFPIGAELSRKPRFFRQFGGGIRKVRRILIGVRHSDACRVCVAATGRLLGAVASSDAEKPFGCIVYLLKFERFLAIESRHFSIAYTDVFFIVLRLSRR